jgi:hypothetical protein
VEQPPSAAQGCFTFGAGFWIRLLARLIDIIVVGFLLGLVAGVFGGIILAIFQATGIVASGWQHRIQGLSAAGFGLSLLQGKTPLTFLLLGGPFVLANIEFSCSLVGIGLVLLIVIILLVMGRICGTEI